ncbi:N-acetylglucosamine kinase [Saltatorellus ferox]
MQADQTIQGPIAVGIDGGGTSTRALLMNAEGVTLGVGTSGSGNLHDMGPERLRAHLDEAWRGAWAAAGEAPRPADAVFCAMASVGTPGNRETVQRLVAEVGVAPLERVEVDIDLAGALAGGLGGGHGIALIAGTGSSCYGRDKSGATFQSGGWGSLLDDVGGATWIGTQAMVAAIRDFDGRGAATTLTSRVMEHFGLQHMRELLPKVDADGAARSARAQLAKLVTTAAQDGDATALEILGRGADALAECVEAVERRLDFVSDATLEVVATGGLAENAGQYLELIHAAVQRRVPKAVCITPRMSNVEGAAMLARARLS